MTLILIPSFDCNFRCKYCYLHNATKHSQCKLRADFICSILHQFKEILRSTNRNLKLIWHGGEPLLWGIDNYRQVFEYIKQELSEIEVQNSIQSNLSLVDDSYIRLLKQYDVKVGFSLDGTKEINDAQRVLKNGKGTFDVIIDKLRLCRNEGIMLGCIAVFSRNSVGKIKQFYNLMNEMQLNFKLNPLFETGETCNAIEELGINVMEYADSMQELFDLMMDDPNCTIVEDNLLEMASAVSTGRTKHCLFGYNCQDNFLAIAPSGDVMPCGRFCDNDLLQYSYGNLHRETLAEILPRIKETETYKRAEYIAASGCKDCRWYHICHGGCLHDGFLASGDFRHKTFLCPAYKRIFAHIEKRMQENGIIQKT